MVSLKIHNPKRARHLASSKEYWFDYYAGFSSQFVKDVIGELNLPKGGKLLDPWNGSGTTTTTACELGIESVGIDINPVMVVVARSKLLSVGVRESLIPIAKEVIATSISKRRVVEPDDPLLTWFTPHSASTVRSLADAIATILTETTDSSKLYCEANVVEISDLAAFYLVAIFRTVRGLLKPFQGSNPTWMKAPPSLQSRIRPSVELLHSMFTSNVHTMCKVVASDRGNPKSDIRLGSSKSLPYDLSSIDAVVASPPYCTRIDYAVATKPELAVLGCPFIDGFHELRRSLIGAPVVAERQPCEDESWGTQCLRFLNVVKSHPSRGSANYYHKLFLQYFGDIHSSLKQIDGVLSSKGQCVLVVQDSNYKNQRVDIAQYFEEMTANLGWILKHRIDFEASQLMSRVNTRSRKYGPHRIATESVLWFEAT